jgi:nucleotide-binding universal stress UspA family protein
VPLAGADEPPPAVNEYLLKAPGHVPSKKNHYSAGKSHDGVPHLYKTTHAAEDRLCLFFRNGWRRPAITTTAWVSMTVYYHVNQPDDVGVAETVYDALQRAGVVENDRLLRLAGSPAVVLIKVARKAEEQVVVRISVFS